MEDYLYKDITNIIYDYNGRELRFKIMDILGISEEKLQKIAYDCIIGYNTKYNIDILILCHIGDKWMYHPPSQKINKCCNRVKKLYYDIYNNNRKLNIYNNIYRHKASKIILHNKSKNTIIICLFADLWDRHIYKDHQELNDWIVLYKNEVIDNKKDLHTKTGKCLYIIGILEGNLTLMRNSYWYNHNLRLKKKILTKQE